ncbi:WecB/TagA/CpsF family glycosyltransferase [Rhodobacteraceae bacterium D3-12]|nr:WecB/TagA/CpsF family glycosyltransferase [Rhodobacteraceae bacterium D3-12]
MTYQSPNADFQFAKLTPTFGFQRTKKASTMSKFIPSLGMTLVDASTQGAIDALLSPSCSRACFINAHCCNVARKDTAYASAVATSGLRLPDGIGVELAAKLSGETLAQNLNGTDLIPKLLEEAARRSLSVFLLGGTAGTADAAAARLVQDIPGLRIAGTANGYADMADPSSVIANINESEADILLVAFGVPFQDVWLAENADRLNPGLLLGVGAFFDFCAGNVTRAPKLVRKARMEWGWRLLMEPRRMARRYLIGNATFLAHAMWREKVGANQTDTLRRALDLTISSCALLLLSPIFIALAVLQKLDSSGPVFYVQSRVGKDGALFNMIKFRSMHVGAHKQHATLAATSEREGLCFKSKTDPRVTRLGRILRATSIDELPQIFNVLRGDMSIVGPRPALPSEVAAYPPRALDRLTVKPGITGVWQVAGRADIGFEKMIDMDFAYTRSRTILLDFFLIFLTFRAVITGRGAY